jgi:hypothetical protein
MATAATPKGTTHNVSTPKASQVPASQAEPDASPHSGGTGFHATAKATHNVSTPSKSQISASQRRPDESPHA